MHGCLVLQELFPEWVDAAVPSGHHPLARVGHIAARWALAALNETDGFLHDAGAAPLGASARVWLGFHHPDVSVSALKLAFVILADAARLRRLDRSRVDAALEGLWELCSNHHPRYQAPILMQGARVRDVPVMPFITGSRFWQHGWGCRSRVFVETSSNADGYLSSGVANSKILSKMVFAELGFPMPEHRIVNQLNELAEAIEVVGWPCVVKPISGGKGRGVTAGISTVSEAEAAFAVARRYSDEAIMVEAFVPGDDHRLMVDDGRFLAAIRREPASVTGDGRSTVGQLIAVLNSLRPRNKWKSRYHLQIVVDDVIEQHLRRQGVAVDTVLAAGRRITLRSNANLSTGGVCFDVTDDVHPHTRQMAEMIARAVGLSAAGIDYITTDIGRPWHECGALIEVNATPGADVLIAAGHDPGAVGSAMLGITPARIPVRLVVARGSELPLASGHLRSMPSTDGFGWACGGEAAIGGMPLRAAPAEPWRAAEMLLRYTSLQRACLVCSVEELMRHGMPIDGAESTILYHCDSTPLPPAWMRVLRDHGGAIGTCSDWSDLRLSDFAKATLLSG
jgi:cyanophycin synthetase